MTNKQITAKGAAPAWTLLGAEPMRALLEYAGMRLMDKAALPRGNGQPVVIFPGLASNKHSTAPLRSFCEDLGYAAYDWGRGFNTGPEGDVDAWLDDLTRHVSELTEEHDERTNLIGWSLGGIYAREVAKRIPSRVRQVITIGTPLADVERTHAGWVYRLVNGHEPRLDEQLSARLRTAPEVPTTSIYSRSDGIVAWQACVHGRNRAHVDEIEVEGSHVGMGWNPEVLSVIAEKLRP
jgi:pimeloyl-ACP methyl ester carboxylesterase